MKKYILIFFFLIFQKSYFSNDNKEKINELRKKIKNKQDSTILIKLLDIIRQDYNISDILKSLYNTDITDTTIKKIFMLESYSHYYLKFCYDYSSDDNFLFRHSYLDETKENIKNFTNLQLLSNNSSTRDIIEKLDKFNTNNFLFSLQKIGFDVFLHNQQIYQRKFDILSTLIIFSFPKENYNIADDVPLITHKYHKPNEYNLSYQEIFKLTMDRLFIENRYHYMNKNEEYSYYDELYRQNFSDPISIKIHYDSIEWDNDILDDLYKLAKKFNLIFIINRDYQYGNMNYSNDPLLNNWLNLFNKKKLDFFKHIKFNYLPFNDDDKKTFLNKFNSKQFNDYNLKEAYTNFPDILEEIKNISKKKEYLCNPIDSDLIKNEFNKMLSYYRFYKMASQSDCFLYDYINENVIESLDLTTELFYIYKKQKKIIEEINIYFLKEIFTNKTFLDTVINEELLSIDFISYFSKCYYSKNFNTLDKTNFNNECLDKLITFLIKQNDNFDNLNQEVNINLLPEYYNIIDTKIIDFLIEHKDKILNKINDKTNKRNDKTNKINQGILFCLIQDKFLNELSEEQQSLIINYFYKNTQSVIFPNDIFIEIMTNIIEKDQIYFEHRKIFLDKINKFEYIYDKLKIFNKFNKKFNEKWKQSSFLKTIYDDINIKKKYLYCSKGEDNFFLKDMINKPNITISSLEHIKKYIDNIKTEKEYKDKDMFSYAIKSILRLKTFDSEKLSKHVEEIILIGLQKNLLEEYDGNLLNKLFFNINNDMNQYSNMKKNNYYDLWNKIKNLNFEDLSPQSLNIIVKFYLNYFHYEFYELTTITFNDTTNSDTINKNKNKNIFFEFINKLLKLSSIKKENFLHQSVIYKDIKNCMEIFWDVYNMGNISNDDNLIKLINDIYNQSSDNGKDIFLKYFIKNYYRKNSISELLTTKEINNNFENLICLFTKDINPEIRKILLGELIPYYIFKNNLKIYQKKINSIITTLNDNMKIYNKNKKDFENIAHIILNDIYNEKYKYYIDLLPEKKIDIAKDDIETKINKLLNITENNESELISPIHNFFFREIVVQKTEIKTAIENVTNFFNDDKFLNTINNYINKYQKQIGEDNFTFDFYKKKINDMIIFIKDNKKREKYIKKKMILMKKMKIEELSKYNKKIQEDIKKKLKQRMILIKKKKREKYIKKKMILMNKMKDLLNYNKQIIINLKEKINNIKSIYDDNFQYSYLIKTNINKEIKNSLINFLKNDHIKKLNFKKKKKYYQKINEFKDLKLNINKLIKTELQEIEECKIYLKQQLTILNDISENNKKIEILKDAEKKLVNQKEKVKIFTNEINYDNKINNLLLNKTLLKENDDLIDLLNNFENLNQIEIEKFLNENKIKIDDFKSIIEELFFNYENFFICNTNDFIKNPNTKKTVFQRKVEELKQILSEINFTEDKSLDIKLMEYFFQKISIYDSNFNLYINKKTECFVVFILYFISSYNDSNDSNDSYLNRLITEIITNNKTNPFISNLLLYFFNRKINESNKKIIFKDIINYNNFNFFNIFLKNKDFLSLSDDQDFKSHDYIKIYNNLINELIENYEISSIKNDNDKINIANFIHNYLLYNNEIPSSKMKIFEEKYSSVTNFININSINDLLNNENIDNEETIQTFTEISPSPIDIYKKKIYLFLKKNTFFIKILIILNIIIFLLWIFILFIGKYLDLFNLEEQPEEEIFKIIPQNIDETHTEQPKIEYEEKPDEFQWIFVN